MSNKELIIKGNKFIIVKHDSGIKYEIKAWHPFFYSYCTFAKAETLDKCKEFANDFINKGLWEGWMK